MLFEIGQKVWVAGASRFGVILSIFHRNNQLWAVLALENYNPFSVYPLTALNQRRYRNANVDVYTYFENGKLTVSCVPPANPDKGQVAKTTQVMKVAV